MISMLEVTFWIVVGLIFYAYFGYSLLLAFVAKVKRIELTRQEIYPAVSLIIAAHNEEGSIKNKLENTINLDYPRDKLEIIVASDASTDRTNQIVKEFSDKFPVKLLSFSEHKGKTFVQNEAVEDSQGEIIIFSDATTRYEQKLVRNIVRNFADARVGAVGGELVYCNENKTSVGEGNGLYWKYEKFLKEKESQIASLIGLSGCCYAIRKELYEPISPDLISDFVIAQIVYKKGKLVIYEPEAISFEKTNDTMGDEFRMRVRVATRTLYGLWCMGELLNPFKYGFFSIQLISHKVLRYLVPFLLILLLVCDSALFVEQRGSLYSAIFILQLIFYSCACVGYLSKRKIVFLSIPFYFVITNMALLFGFLNFICGKKQTIWKPLRK